MRVVSVLLSAAARTGGPPAFVGQSALELHRAGEEMVVLSTDLALAPTGWRQPAQRRIAYDERHASLQHGDVRVFAARLPRRLAFSPALYRAACELAASSDLVHLHSLWHFPQYAGYRAASRARTPYIVSPHGALDPYLRRRGRVRKGLSTWLYQERLLREASLIHVTTDAEADLIADVATEVPRSIVPCGLYVQEFRELPAREVFRRRYLHGYGGPVILFLGRITYKKGVERLLRAFAHVRRQGECRLVVVGPDDEGLRPGLERLALELKVAQDVHFLGPLYGEERRAALATADVWALCSYTENFGIAVIEAMAAGCAVCISPGVNVAADVTGAEAGVVAGLEPEEFGEALAQLLADNARRLRLGSAARRFADRYDWSAVTPRLLEMYRRAVAQPDR